LALIERSRDAARDELGSQPRLLMHGGGSGALLARLENATHVPAWCLRAWRGGPVPEPRQNRIMFARALFVLLLVLNVGVAAWWAVRAPPSAPARN
jgi:hypothetical protein